MHPATARPVCLTEHQLKTQIDVAKRHVEHAHRGLRQKATETQMRSQQETISFLEKQLSTLAKTVEKGFSSVNVKLRESQKTTTPTSSEDNRSVATLMAKQFQTSNDRALARDREDRARETYTELKQQAQKLFQNKGLLDAKGHLLLGEGGAAIKALRLFRQAFVDRTTAGITNVADIAKLGSDVYIEVMSAFLPTHVGK